MNTELLLRVRDHIVANPDQFNIHNWDCGTTACIAGWAMRLNGTPISDDAEFAENIEKSVDLLGLLINEGYRLFFIEDWPENFVRHEFGFDDPQTTPYLAARRIDHFIATNGQE